MRTPSDFPAPEPFLATRDLAAVVTLPDLEHVEGEGEAWGEYFELPFEVRRALTERDRYRRWLAEARALAAAGVQPGPSHTISGDAAYASDTAFAYTWELDGRGPYRGDAPVVILAHRVRGTRDLDREIPFLPSGYPWRAISTQSSGVACHHPRFIGLVLEPTADGLASARRLNRFCDWSGTHQCLGISGVALSDAVAYAWLLRELGLSAEGAWVDLEEAVYPLDRECASRLSATPVPSPEETRLPLDEVLTWRLEEAHPDRPPSGQRGPSALCVYVLGDNCD